MHAPLIVEYDAHGDILYLGKTRPYSAQHSEEVDFGVVARLNADSREVENIEILFFSQRMKDPAGLRLPVIADFRLPQAV